jgi:hypothetical protein
MAARGRGTEALFLIRPSGGDGVDRLALPALKCSPRKKPRAKKPPALRFFFLAIEEA